MAIFITGDIHGSVDITKLKSRRLDPKGLTRDDYVIILGDFGLVWHEPETGEESYWLDWLEDKPWTTLFVDGNHENFDLLDSLPVREWHGGRVQYVRDHVIHLCRGEVFEIDGRTFFVMGGAASHDKQYRKEGKSWWPGEVPSEKQREQADEVLAKHTSFDYVLSHEAPSEAVLTLTLKYDQDHVETPHEYSAWLQEHVANRVKFTRWFFGHYHLDTVYETPYTCLYNEIFDLDDTGRTEYGSSNTTW